MRCLIVITHPLKNSLGRYFAEQAIFAAKAAGHEVEVKDLYLEGFSPALTESERSSYYSAEFNADDVQRDVKQLLNAEMLVLVFPTWWFGFPAILKGWFDRVWAPGVAYDHASDLGPIKPRLENLKEVKVITSLGSPWWVDTFLMWRPVYRTLRVAILGTCARSAKFKMISLYKAEKVSAKRAERFVGKIRRLFT